MTQAIADQDFSEAQRIKDLLAAQLATAVQSAADAHKATVESGKEAVTAMKVEPAIEAVVEAVDEPAIEAVDEVEAAVDYSKMKLPELKKLCKGRKIKGFSTKKKLELVELLKHHDSAPVVESVEEPGNAKKTKKPKKIKKTKNAEITSENRCVARLWDNKNFTGTKQCSRVRLEGSDYCKSCHSKAFHPERSETAELVGPTLWKWCSENGVKRKDTKGKHACLWFGRVDQFEEGTDDVPVTSFRTADGKRRIVVCYRDNVRHLEIANAQVLDGALFATELFEKKDIDWPKKWHPLGVAEKKRASDKKASSRKPKKVAKSSQDPFEAVNEEDGAGSEEMEITSTASSTPSTTDSGNTFVTIVRDDVVYEVNVQTFEIRHTDGEFRGGWVIKTDDDVPTNPSRDWLAAGGYADEEAKQYGASLIPDDSESEDSESEED